MDTLAVHIREKQGHRSAYMVSALSQQLYMRGGGKEPVESTGEHFTWVTKYGASGVGRRCFSRFELCVVYVVFPSDSLIPDGMKHSARVDSDAG